MKQRSRLVLRTLGALLSVNLSAACGTPSESSAVTYSLQAAETFTPIAPQRVAPTPSPSATLLPLTATPEATATAASPTPVSAGPGATAPKLVDLVDPKVQQETAVEGLYQRVADVDLDGDGAAERVVLIANAIIDQGQPLWDDGQTWQIYVEEPDGTRTYVYARFLQLGHLKAHLTRATAPWPPTLLLEEWLPYQLSLYEVRYQGTSQTQAVELVTREFGQYEWAGAPEP